MGRGQSNLLYGHSKFTGGRTEWDTFFDYNNLQLVENFLSTLNDQDLLIRPTAEKIELAGQIINNLAEQKYAYVDSNNNIFIASSKSQQIRLEKIFDKLRFMLLWDKSRQGVNDSNRVVNDYLLSQLSLLYGSRSRRKEENKALFFWETLKEHSNLQSKKGYAYLIPKKKASSATGKKNAYDTFHCYSDLNQEPVFDIFLSGCGKHLKKNHWQPSKEKALETNQKIDDLSFCSKCFRMTSSRSQDKLLRKTAPTIDYQFQLAYSENFGALNNRFLKLSSTVNKTGQQLAEEVFCQTISEKIINNYEKSGVIGQRLTTLSQDLLLLEKHCLSDSLLNKQQLQQLSERMKQLPELIFA
jgi:hypothetical protein